jgi:hypothetical protein
VISDFTEAQACPPTPEGDGNWHPRVIVVSLPKGSENLRGFLSGEATLWKGTSPGRTQDSVKQ